MTTKVDLPENTAVSHWLAELRMECYKKNLENFDTVKVGAVEWCTAIAIPPTHRLCAYIYCSTVRVNIKCMHQISRRERAGVLN